jgi:hypothetical protein
MEAIDRARRTCTGWTGTVVDPIIMLVVQGPDRWASRNNPSHPLQQEGSKMSIFGKIMGAIFGPKAGATPAPGGSAPGVNPTPASSSAAPAAPSVDIAPILDSAVAAKKEKLEWRTSIVDLMKALDIDSSLAARKELAKELNYTGDTNDSASMNIWLHKQVIVKIVANGGKVPADLKH